MNLGIVSKGRGRDESRDDSVYVGEVLGRAAEEPRPEGVRQVRALPAEAGAGTWGGGKCARRAAQGVAGQEEKTRASGTQTPPRNLGSEEVAAAVRLFQRKPKTEPHRGWAFGR